MPEPPATLAIRVTPRSATPGVGPWRDGMLHVRVARPPTGGEATAAALAAVADALGVPRTAVRLVHGERGRLKRVAVTGLTAAALAGRLKRFEEGKEAPD